MLTQYEQKKLAPPALGHFLRHRVFGGSCRCGCNAGSRGGAHMIPTHLEIRSYLRRQRDYGATLPEMRAGFGRDVTKQLNQLLELGWAYDSGINRQGETVWKTHDKVE
jgi:hypothetical protein